MPHEPQKEAGERGRTFRINITCVMEIMWLVVLHKPMVSLLTYVPYTVHAVNQEPDKCIFQNTSHFLEVQIRLHNMYV